MALLNTIKEIGAYFSEIFQGVVSLLKGLRVTGGYFLKPSAVVTQQYPENRGELKMFDNFKGELTLIHDENNQHSCDACNNCARKCPNGSIEVVSVRVQGEDGRSKRMLQTYIYHLEMCTFCGLCVPACEQNALEFGQEFEHAVFDKSKLTKVLNKPGSTSKAKEK
jgi:NADH-quinone oxidoreductase subunit I